MTESPAYFPPLVAIASDYWWLYVRPVLGDLPTDALLSLRNRYVKDATESKEAVEQLLDWWVRRNDLNTASQPPEEGRS